MKKSFLIAGVIVALGVVAYFVFGNSSNNNSNSNTGTNQSATPSVTSETNNSSQLASSVEIKDMAFVSSSLTVKKGATVTWTNKDGVEHDVIVDSGEGPKSDLLSQGESYTFKFDTVGTFKYHCSVHPSMTGTVTVTE